MNRVKQEFNESLTLNKKNSRASVGTPTFEAKLSEKESELKSLRLENLELKNTVKMKELELKEKNLTFSGLCIFDDASAILPSDISGKAKTMLRNLVSIRRQLDTDFIFNFHSLNNVPPFISDVASDLVIFRGNIKLRGNKFDEVAQEVQQIVNDISKKEKYNYGYISIDEGFYYIASIENGKEEIKFAKRF